MKKVLIFALAIAILLTACAAGQTAAPTAAPIAAPTKAAFPTADTSMATPESGSATVLPREGVKAIELRSRPDANAPVSGIVHPEEQGKFLGTDPSGKWVLVEINGQTGWALFLLFSLIVVQ